MQFIRNKNEKKNASQARSFAHFQSQGKNLAPDQTLCKWELLKDFPFGSWKIEKEQERHTENKSWSIESDHFVLLEHIY